MKTKLLKKIRSRFEILYYPNGKVLYWLGNRHLIHKEYGLIRLEDNLGRYSISYSLEKRTVEEATNLAKARILELAQQLYGNHNHDKKYRAIKLWHNAKL